MSNIADNSLESGAKSGSSSAITPTISQGSSPKAVLSDLENLVTTGWSLDELAVGIEKSFLFKSWTKCLDFVAVVGTECKVKNHHPTIILVSSLRWNITDLNGLSWQKDVRDRQDSLDHSSTSWTI